MTLSSNSGHASAPTPTPTPIPNWCPPVLKPWNWRELLDPSSESLLEAFKSSELQDASSVRLLKLNLALAQELLDETGRIDLAKLTAAKKELAGQLYRLKSDCSGEGRRLQHVLRVLEWLSQHDIRDCFEKTTHGHDLLGVDRLILLALRAWPGYEHLNRMQLTDRHVRIALLSGWLSFLRQAVGSCFATAPAILVLTHQPMLFLQDMQQLLHHGYLKRTLSGKELVVPAAEDPGLADLRRRLLPRPALLRSPGLMWSLEKAGVIKLTGSWQKDLDLFANQLEPLSRAVSDQEGLYSAQSLMESFVCDHFKLSLKQLREQQKLPPKTIASGSLQLSSGVKTALVEQAIDSLAIAKEAFCLWTDHPLLRMWEFTLASFSDTRQEGCLWSLHTSLGLNYDQPSSLAQCLYQVLQDKVSEYNEKSRALQPDCENMHYQVQHVLGRLKSAQTDHELTWLRVEYQNLKAELDQLEQERDHFHFKASAFAGLYNALLDLYIVQFDLYFQQIYDPQMRGADVGPYDDSPAGFRLVFKAGRSSASSWMPIYSSAQFIDAIARFLSITEQEMSTHQLIDPIREDFSHIVTLLVQHVRSHEFLRSAYVRMSKGLHLAIDISSPEAMESSPITPWAYVSGGTMRTLVSHYYGRSEGAEEKQKWFRDVRELWVFLIDIMRDMRTSQSQRFVDDPSLGLLMHSATHAFLFVPGHPSFLDSWSSTTYPYTWIRDFYELPLREIYSSNLLDATAQSLIWDKFIKESALEERLLAQPSAKVIDKERLADERTIKERTNDLARFIRSTRLRPAEFRRECLNQVNSLQLPVEQKSALIALFDGLLLRMLPILDQTTLLRRMEEFGKQSPLPLLANRLLLTERWQEEVKGLGPQVSADDLLSSFYRSYRSCLESNPSRLYAVTPEPFELRKELARFGLGLPMPIFFADSNWDHYHFAFVLNPGTDQLELWRLQPDSLLGEPMNDWKLQFYPNALEASGSAEEEGSTQTSGGRLWGVYHNTEQYLPVLS